MDINFSSEGGTKKYRYSLSCDANVSVYSSDSWFSASVNQIDNIITIVVQQNSGGDRTGVATPYIKNSPCTNSSKLFNIFQEGNGGGGCNEFSPAIKYGDDCSLFEPTIKYGDDCSLFEPNIDYNK